MPVLVKCPNPDCGKKFQVEESLLGRNGRCKICGQRFPLVQQAAVVTRIRSESSFDSNKPQVAATGEAPKQVGRFQVRARLGSGAFGTVYRAYDPQLDREVALKVPHPGVLNNPNASNASCAKPALLHASATRTSSLFLTRVRMRIGISSLPG